MLCVYAKYEHDSRMYQTICCNCFVLAQFCSAALIDNGMVQKRLKWFYHANLNRKV